MIDKGAAASVMSLSCWKGLGSPELSKSTTMLTTFDGDRLGHTGSFLLLKSLWEGRPLR